MIHPQHDASEFLREPAKAGALGQGRTKKGVPILLTQGLVALVDESDYERVCRLKWRVLQQGENRYAQAHVRTESCKKTTISLHRYVIQLPDGLTVHHLNGNGLDCRWSNLKLVSFSQNLHFQRKATRELPPGVYVESSGRFRVRVWLHGKAKSIGTYSSLEDALREREIQLILKVMSEARTKPAGMSCPRSNKASKRPARRIKLRE